MSGSLTDRQIERFNSLYEEAIELQKNLVRLDGAPKSKPGIFGRKKLEKSIQLFEEALKIHSKSWQSMYFIGKAYQAMDDMDKALSWFVKAARIESLEPSVAKEAGLCAAKLGRHAVAIRVMKDAAEAHPDDAALQCNIGLSYLMSEKLDEARSAFSLAVQADPGNEMNRKLLKLAESVAAGEIRCPRSERDILGLV